MKVCQDVLTLMSFQTCTSFCLILNIKDDIWKNAGDQTKLVIYFPTMEVSGDQELFGSSKYLVLCST